ncbi:hypothetical protein BAE44_0012757 [Dichanthelium oligosanthes]|uniref:Uncharacterized protein n=1 Tax=Dichanthelium oligosanthes TaxID=888268 RepID=A0A1E5VM67_9POAL|nr:hypothetical protein BAE44_0012757 [Dichanthelium oligosanthes]
MEPAPQRTEPRVEPTPQRKSTEVQSAPPIHDFEDQDGGGGKKRKQSQMVAKLGDFIEFRKNHIEKIIEKLDDKKRCEDDYSVETCIDIVDTLEELIDDQKVDANELFQSEMNRQIFVKTKNPDVRLIWLKKKISQVYSLTFLCCKCSTHFSCMFII